MDGTVAVIPGQRKPAVQMVKEFAGLLPCSVVTGSWGSLSISPSVSEAPLTVELKLKLTSPTLAPLPISLLPFKALTSFDL